MMDVSFKLNLKGINLLPAKALWETLRFIALGPKKEILILFFSGIVTSSYEQDIQQVAPHIPTSPQAEAFQKYGEYAINYSTGIPDISIPLYEINHRGYKIPLVLKYNPLPLKPYYNYDVYGHGWNLSVNSCVSRTIEGYPDEQKNFKLDDDKFSNYYFTPPSSAVGCTSDYTCNMSNLSHTDLSGYDMAHDKFSVVLPNGKSFDFVMANTNNGLKYFVSVGEQVKITCSCDLQNIYSFTIIDDDGVKYTFDSGDTPYRGTSSFNSYVSWQLSQINLPNSTEPITFSYNKYIETPYAIACQEPGIKIEDYRVISSTPSFYPHSVNAESFKIGSTYFYKMKLLSSINYGNTSVQLIYQYDNTIANYNYVNEIKILDNSLLLKDIKLDKTIHTLNGYCSSYNLAKLDSISIWGADLSVKPEVYRCTYKSSAYGFVGTDHWGYLNNYDISYDVANFNLFIEFDPNYYGLFYHNASLSSVEKTSQDLSPYYKLKLSRTNFNNRQPGDPEEHGVLTRIKFPTGGYTDFEFENHRFLTSTDMNGNFIYDRQKREVAKASGFRIRKIINYTADGNVAQTLNYRYGKTDGEIYGSQYPFRNSHIGVGVAVVDPNILTYMNFASIYCDIPIKNMILGLNGFGKQTSFINPFNDFYYYNNIWKWECSFSASNFRRIVNGRPPVLYPEVTVYYGEINEDSYYPTATAGKTVYKYNLTSHNFDLLGNECDDAFIEEPFYNNNSLTYYPVGFRYNNLNEKRDYKFDGGNYNLVKKEEYGWGSYSNCIGEYIPNTPYPSGLYNPWATIGEFYSGSSYNPGISFMNFKQSTIYSASGDSSVILTENYNYNSRNQLVSKSSTNSKEQTVIKTFSYPEVATTGTTPDIVQKMIAKNIISPVIQSTTQVGESYGTPTETYGYKTDFDEFTTGSSKLILPAKAYELEIKPSGNEYVLKDQITGYSENGNPLEFIAKNNIRSSYIWGYNDRYMVVKADNIDSAALAGFVTASLPSGFSTLENLLNSFLTLPNSNWTNFNRNLRNRVPSNVMITTYTYSPLIGVTSTTDPNSKTTYYNYDSSGRLVAIKDDNGNILKEYTYHYKE